MALTRPGPSQVASALLINSLSFFSDTSQWTVVPIDLSSLTKRTSRALRKTKGRPALFSASALFKCISDYSSSNWS